MTRPILFSTFIKKVFTDVIWRDRKYYKDWLFDVNLFMIKKNQAEKKELSILLYILNDSVYKDHWLRGVSEHSQAEFRLKLSKAGLSARVFHGLPSPWFLSVSSYSPRKLLYTQ